jgi:hypothetical protein
MSTMITWCKQPTCCGTLLLWLSLGCMVSCRHAVENPTGIKIQIPDDHPQELSVTPQAEWIEDLSTLPPLGSPNQLLAVGNFSPDGAQFPRGAMVTWPLRQKQTPGTRLWIVTYNAQQASWLGTGEMATVGSSGLEATGRIWHCSNNGVSSERPLRFRRRTPVFWQADYKVNETRDLR